MSESDSENDYESAGEDTEESVSKSEDVISSSSPSEAIAGPNQNDAMIEKVEAVKNDGSQKSLNELEASNSECKVEEPKDNASNIKASSITKSTSETDKSIEDDNDMQPKRVTLRLEQKLKERNKQAATLDEPVKSPPKTEEKAAASWGFGSWGSSLLSTAASSVTTFTSQVSQGIGTVLETVETTLGAPPPEELASILKEKRENEELENQEQKEDENKTKDSMIENEESTGPASTALFTGVSSLTKVVGNTGSKVLMGGLDTLELIGKKTMDIITERDPGLRNARSNLASGMTLSHMLREAKEKAEADQKHSFDDDDDEEETLHYSQIFDEHNGLVHLEALEMLSSQNESELQRAVLKITDDSHEKHIINEIGQICDIQPSDELLSTTDLQQDFDDSILEDLEPEQLSISFEKIRTVRDVAHTWVDDCIEKQEKGEETYAKEVHQYAITNLAYFTAKSIEQFHKFGELVMVIRNVGESDTLTSAKNLKRLTIMLNKELNMVAAKYCQCLNTIADKSEDPSSVTPLITNVYLEASNSTTCIHDALQLLVPVLQMTLL